MLSIYLGWNYWIMGYVCSALAFPGGSVIKNLPANSEATGDAGWIPGLGRTPEGGKWQHPLQYSCLENPMDRGVWWAIQSMGSQRLRRNLVTEHKHTCLALTDAGNQLSRVVILVYTPTSNV